MAIGAPQREPDQELEELISERRAKLLEAGYSPCDAAMLARSFYVDVGEAVLLVKRGCPSFTARRILA